MEANELRVGNYVLDRGGKVLLIDHWERKDKVSTKLEENRHPLKEYIEFLEPIPLTEDWLLKFGFDVICERNEPLSNLMNVFKPKKNT